MIVRQEDASTSVVHAPETLQTIVQTGPGLLSDLQHCFDLLNDSCHVTRIIMQAIAKFAQSTHNAVPQFVMLRALVWGPECGVGAAAWRLPSPSKVERLDGIVLGIRDAALDEHQDLQHNTAQ